MLREPKSLYRLETLTDPDAGEILRYVPITRDGVQDPLRTVRFQGRVSLTSPDLPPFDLTFELPGEDLAAALAAWPDALKTAVETFDSQRRRAALLQGVGTGRG